MLLLYSPPQRTLRPTRRRCSNGDPQPGSQARVRGVRGSSWGRRRRKRRHRHQARRGRCCFCLPAVCSLSRPVLSAAGPPSAPRHPAAGHQRRSCSPSLARAQDPVWRGQHGRRQRHPRGLVRRGRGSSAGGAGATDAAGAAGRPRAHEGQPLLRRRGRRQLQVPRPAPGRPRQVLRVLPGVQGVQAALGTPWGRTLHPSARWDPRSPCVGWRGGAACRTRRARRSAARRSTAGEGHGARALSVRRPVRSCRVVYTDGGLPGCARTAPVHSERLRPVQRT